MDTFVAGCAGGMAQVIAGQPFDMIKVRLQATQNAYKSVFDCLTRIIKYEGGPFALWKGSLSPLLSVGAAVALQFGVNERTRNFVKEYTGSSQLKLSHYFACGVTAGLTNSVISIPTEHSRIRMQIQPKNAQSIYTSSIDCGKKILNEYGWKGLYKGGVPTMLREGTAFGLYFSFYEWMISQMLTPGENRAQLNMSSVALAGSLTGLFVWIATYPIDIIKTRIQVDNFLNPEYKGSFDCLKKSVKSHGLSGLYKGFTPCALRAMPANGATFIAYETTMQLMDFSRQKGSKGKF